MVHATITTNPSPHTRSLLSTQSEDSAQYIQFLGLRIHSYLISHPTTEI